MSFKRVVGTVRGYVLGSSIRDENSGITYWPGTPDAYVAEGDNALKDKNPGKAIKKYESAIKLFSDEEERVRPEYAKRKIAQLKNKVDKLGKAISGKVKYLSGTPSTSTNEGQNLTARLSSIIAIAGIFGGLFFFSNTLTGNVIANVTNSTSNFLGVGLLVIGLVSGFVWVKKK